MSSKTNNVNKKYSIVKEANCRFIRVCLTNIII